jgi:hypothetical protein
MTKLFFGNVETLFNVGSPFCIEISLRTPENQTMILETWCILFNDQLADYSQKINYNVYKKMSSVLRSLMCITRSTPTYQLSRRQNADTYVLLYRMYCGEPIVHYLGENYATAKVGTVSTPIGSLIVNLAYRTRLTMTSQHSSHSYDSTGSLSSNHIVSGSLPSSAGGPSGGGIQIKDDHFNLEQQQQMIYRQHRVDSLNSDQYSSTSYSPVETRRLNRAQTTLALINNNNAAASSPTSNHLIDYHSQPASSSTSSLAKKSLSNLNTITEGSSIGDTGSNISSRRPSTKTQPIPMMKTSTSAQQLNQKQNYSPTQHRPIALNNNTEESSADECNSSSVASTPDTKNFFRLKNAAFVPMTSFSSNNNATDLLSLAAQYGGQGSVSSASDLTGTSVPNEMPPFLTLLTDEFVAANNNNNPDLIKQRLNNETSLNMTQQSPPPMQNLSLFDNNNMNQFQLKHQLDDENQSSPIGPNSLPNFKLIEQRIQQANRMKHHLHLSNNNNNMISNSANTMSLMAPMPEDFVFIESVIILFILFYFCY